MVLGGALLVFAFAAGPVWRHRWEPNAAILWSYAVIPPLVFGAFFRRGTPRLVPVLVESLLLSIGKFGISAFVLVTLWSFGTPPPAVRATRLLEDVLRPKSTERSLKVKKGVGAAGARRVKVAQDVRVGNGGFSLKVINLAPGEDLALRATDGRLHAVEILSADGTILRNVPVLGSGVARLFTFEEISSGSSLRCAIHPEERADLTAEPRR